jgi:hypothetical protein
MDLYIFHKQDQGITPFSTKISTSIESTIVINTHYYKSWFFQLKILTKKYTYWTLVKKPISVILVKTNWLVVFLTSWVVGYLISQINRQIFWEAMFLGLIFYF